MSDPGGTERYFIGWDVGGWNCDKNANSRDAIVILDADLNIVGTPWRGNLRQSINEAGTTRDWLEALFTHCQANKPADTVQAVLAIDTPLGFSTSFTRLVTQLECEESIGQSATNPYLFRETETFLFDHGLNPLSAIKDMIGSQATKGMHILAKFAPHVTRCGIWTDGELLTAIEAYPSACKTSPLIQGLLARYVARERHDPAEKIWIDPINHQDKVDALTCALVAHVFASQPEALAHPPQTTPKAEGWIWAPTDALRLDANRRVIIE